MGRCWSLQIVVDNSSNCDGAEPVCEPASGTKHDWIASVRGVG